MDWLEISSLIVFALEWLLRIGLAARVLLRRCPRPASLTWLVLLLFVPVISVVLYALIGENRLGVRRARRFEALTREIESQSIRLWKHQHLDWDQAEQRFLPIARLSTAVSATPPLSGNALELMDNATEVLDRLVADIDTATHHCHLIYYIWQPAGGGVHVANALIRAARRGVACRVLVDAVGGAAFFRSSLPSEMRAAGVDVRPALPVNNLRMLLARIDLRNHRKLAVIDGKIAYCGSQNLTDESFRNRRNKKVGPWIDATMRIRGPACQALQTVFIADWLADSDENLQSVEGMFPAPELPGPSVVHVLPSGAGHDPDALHQALLASLFAAREEIIMTTPYLVPDDATKAALCNAALRGVDVTLVVPEVLDARLVAAASRAHYREFLEAGIKIMHHPAGLLHSKTVCIDRDFAIVGSANIDMRSFWINFELTLFVYDAEFASILRFMQQKYIAESEQIFLDRWRCRPAWKSLRDHAAQLLGPLL